MALRFALNFRDIEDSIRFYDGTSKISIESWVTDFEEIACIMGWDEFQKLVFAKKSLKGIAKMFVMSEKGITTWNKLKTSLIKEFMRATNSADIHKMLCERKILSNENVTEYFYNMKEIASRGNVENDALIHYIIDGIKDINGNKAILYGAKNLDEFKEKLCDYQIYTSKQEAPSHHVRQYEKKEYTTIQYNKPDRCFNCGEIGHSFTNCPNKSKGAKCFKCNNFGHLAKDCKNNKKIEEKDVDVQCLMITKKTVADDEDEEKKKEDTATKEVIDNEDTVDIANLKYKKEQLQRSDYVTEQQQLRMDYESQMEQLHKALEQKQKIISSYQREHDILEEEKEEYEDEMDVVRERAERADRLEFENQKFKEELRKEKETHYHELEKVRKEKESIMLKFANQEKLFIDVKKEKDVFEKQLIQAKRNIENEEEQDEVYEKNDEEDNTSQELVVKKKYENAIKNERETEISPINKDIIPDLITTTSIKSLHNEDKEKSEKTEDVAITVKTTDTETLTESTEVKEKDVNVAEEEILDLAVTTVGITDPDDDELDEIEKEFVKNAEVLDEDSLEESKMYRRFKDSSVAVNDYYELKHKFREKSKAVQ